VQYVEREAVLVGIDVGTSKVCALIGEVSRDGRLTIMGHGTVPASGLKKGVVINIDQTVRSIADAVERAERLSGWKIDRAFVGVGGQHVESLNSRGQVAVTAHHREVTREDVNRAIEVARAVSIPSNRDVLHVDDLVRGLKLLAARDAAIGESFILGGPEHLTLDELITVLARAAGRSRSSADVRLDERRLDHPHRRAPPAHVDLDLVALADTGLRRDQGQPDADPARG